MNIFSWLRKTLQGFEGVASSKPTPADFRRGVRKRGIHIFGFSIDHNSKHVGSFKGSVTPIKRRFKGVSRTANKS